MPSVFNKHHGDAPKDAVYVGRPTVWGNQFSHLEHARGIVSVKTRDEAVEAHEAWIMTQPAVVALVKKELRGKDLVCWCAPKRCHADTLLRIANTF